MRTDKGNSHGPKIHTHTCVRERERLPDSLSTFLTTITNNEDVNVVTSKPTCFHPLIAEKCDTEI